MPIKNLPIISLLKRSCIAVLATAAGHAIAENVPQDAPKPTIESVTTPIENIVINGKPVPLSLKTLADLQRFNEEKELKEKIEESLGQKKPDAKPNTNPPPTTSVEIVTPVGNGLVGPSTQLPTPKPSYKNNQILSVFGPLNDMQAEVYTTGGQIVSIRQGNVIDQYQVVALSSEGITVSKLKQQGATKLVRVGQQIK